ncbi:fructosamine kinase family protein [Salinibacillus xinjiangensis]|uniref:Phosphotransferase n=1 Tax=Salinibacillus xinjiangensis TaxID=1229268 RepID=A0A6G1X5Q1_9BACI|nr:fructosamine kinase family protein [Salinibacillus xinjiangensis]MRG86267.1 phosphotransferase [Salinibacillus xinjiangensis]
MHKFISNLLNQIQHQNPITKVTPISGGSINNAYYVETTKSRFFIKTNTGVSPHFFQAEAKGLQFIEESNTIDVPQVYFYNNPAPDETGVIVLEWIEGEKTAQTDEQLGHSLASLHKTTGSHFGFEEDTFIGELPHPNGLYENWVAYYRDCRLTPQYKTGIQSGKIVGQRKRQMEKLLNHLDQWLNHSPKPSLLHGDLWGGNWIVGPAGKPYLIDPSVLYGDHLFELAFTELFGGFSSTVYHAYEDVFPIPTYYKDIQPLYQLYYLLVHLNLFGEGYGRSVDRILKRYIG